MISEERKEILSLIMKFEGFSFLVGDIFAIIFLGLAALAGKNGMYNAAEGLMVFGIIIVFVGLGGTVVSHLIGRTLEKKWNVHCLFRYE